MLQSLNNNNKVATHNKVANPHVELAASLIKGSAGSRGSPSAPTAPDLGIPKSSAGLKEIKTKTTGKSSQIKKRTAKVMFSLLVMEEKIVMVVFGILTVAVVTT